MKKFFILFCILSIMPFIEVKAKHKVERRNGESTKASDSLDSLFNVQDDSRLPTPVFKEPSAFMAWVRSKGLAFLYWTIKQYNSCRHWCRHRYRVLFKAKKGYRLP